MPDMSAERPVARPDLYAISTAHSVVGDFRQTPGPPGLLHGPVFVLLGSQSEHSADLLPELPACLLEFLVFASIHRSIFRLSSQATPGQGTQIAYPTTVPSEMKPGNTPLVELHRFAPAGTRLLAKLEWFNPTGSIKDRAAWFMFHNAVQNGRLAPGQPLIEATSGNTGIGVARLAQIYDHPMVICLPSAATEERQKLLRAYGAELIVVEGGPNDAFAYARKLVDAGEGHMLYQYGNRWNAYAHFFGTSQEVLHDWPLEAPPPTCSPPSGRAVRSPAAAGGSR